MNSTMISTLPTPRRWLALAAATATEVFRQPAYDCQDRPDAMVLTLYIPGVAAAGVEIEGRGTDLTVTARKSHLVRINFDALHLERVQGDYRLRLRLGRSLDYAAMEAEITNGVLTIILPKRGYGITAAALRRVA